MRKSDWTPILMLLGIGALVYWLFKKGGGGIATSIIPDATMEPYPSYIAPPSVKTPSNVPVYNITEVTQYNPLRKLESKKFVWV